MSEHYIDCEVCGTIVSIGDSRGSTRSADGYTYTFKEVLLDITASHNGKTFPAQVVISFCGQKMEDILTRYEVGDVVVVRFTPKCKETVGRYGTKYYSYNLGYRIILANESQFRQ